MFENTKKLTLQCSGLVKFQPDFHQHHISPLFSHDPHLPAQSSLFHCNKYKTVVSFRLHCKIKQLTLYLINMPFNFFVNAINFYSIISSQKYNILKF